MKSGISKWLARLGPSAPNALLQELAPPGLLDELTPSQRLKITATEIKVVLASTKGIYTAIVAAFLIAATAAWVSGSFLQRALCAVWLVLLIVGLGHSAYACASFKRMPKSIEETLEIGRRERAVAGYCCGSLWGASSWIMLPTSEPVFQAFLMVCIALVMAGGAGAMAVYRPLMLSSLVPMAAIFSLGVLRLGGAQNTVIALGFGILAYTITEYAKVQEQALQTAIALRFKTENLLGEIREQQQLTAQALTQAEASREAAEIANQGKTTFLAAAGHDLRQPMHALVQYFGHLKRRNTDPALGETVARMGKALDAMQDLLDSVLEVSKLMMGAVRPTIAPFSVDEVIDRLDAQLRPIAEDKGLRFVVVGDSSIVETDEVLLERILRNLVLNAIRYTDRGRVVVRCRRRRDRLSIQVWDTGIGIAKAEQGKIFEEFYQVSNDARDRRKGLGLGLALVRQLSALLGLRLRMRSSLRRGSVFMVEVPAAAVARAPEPAPAIEHDFVRHAFVVLIDDNEAGLEATASTLADFGCHVVAARSGLQAIEMLQGQEFMPQLVISDYRLEHGETGIDAIRMVVANQKALFGDEFDIPALVISGDTAPNELKAVLEAGYAMLHKPLKPEALHAAVNHQLARSVLAVESQA